MIRLQAIAPNGTPYGEVFETDAGAIVVITCREQASTKEREEAAVALGEATPPGAVSIVLPHGYRIDVLRPVAE